jgi:hypothetical protein
VVTIIDGVEVIEVIREDLDGHPLETTYYVRGEKHTALKEAWEMAKKIAEERRDLNP